MGKIQCLKLECPQCHIIGLAQIFLRKDGRVRYARIRHYEGLNENKKPQFEYHKVEDLDVLKTLLKFQGISLSHSIGQNGQAQTKTHRPKLKELNLKQQNKCLGSLAWWGTALVRRRSRDQSPPEALHGIV